MPSYVYSSGASYQNLIPDTYKNFRGPSKTLRRTFYIEDLTRSSCKNFLWE